MENINRDSLFKEIQTYLTETPVVLAGTGVSIPAGIPGMNELSTFLQNELKEKYKENTKWQKITNRLDEGIDLESALTGVDVKGELLNDIVNLTWKLVSDSDIKFFYKVTKSLPIALPVKFIEAFDCTSQAFSANWSSPVMSL